MLDLKELIIALICVNITMFQKQFYAKEKIKKQLPFPKVIAFFPISYKKKEDSDAIMAYYSHQ